MFHNFDCDISGICLPEKFTYPFCYKPHPLVVEAARQVQEYLSGREDWADEIGGGKMFGILVVADRLGNVGFLAAFSGNIARSNNHPYFVPPVYDLLRPDGFFRKGEDDISSINRKIEALESSDEYGRLQRELDALMLAAGREIESYRQQMRASKMRRDSMRLQGISTDGMVRESQFEKAELRRIKQRWHSAIEAAVKELDKLVSTISRLKAERKRRSAELQRRLFDCFVVYNARGGKSTLTEIFERERHELPPAGAGECAAPKLLQYAYLNGLHPLAMGEFWWGRPSEAVVRRHLHFYPACKSKCEPILRFMLQGLDVESNPLDNRAESDLTTVYEDDSLWVVDKPEGMLSVPGKGCGPSVWDVARNRFPSATGPLVVHRLDMHTSGLLVVAKTKAAHEDLQRQFAERRVHKEYMAILKGNVKQDSGVIDLPVSPDYFNRPAQVVDFEGGKRAVTEYHVLERCEGFTRVKFVPLTGRTHQLRVHSSHPLGLDAPIKGDMLYGEFADRLYLHASRIVFLHPLTHRRIELSSEPPF